MRAQSSRGIAAKILAVFSLILLFPGVLLAGEYFDRYDLSPDSPTVDFGVQPLSYPSGVVSAVMRHDRILKKALADIKQPLKTFPFIRSGDMLSFVADHRLEGGIFGDVSTILSASIASVWIVGLTEQVSTGIVVKGSSTISGLAGKRIGYVEASTAYYVLQQGLASAGLNESQVRLVRMHVDEMPDALERGDIDAFAGWDPATTIALRNSDKTHIVFRGMSQDFFVIERDFEQRSPEAARYLVAGLLRAVEWMRRSQSNLENAVRWAMADAEAFSGKPEKLSVSEIAAITKRNLLSVPSAPVVVFSPGAPPLKTEYQFLQKQGKLSAAAKWDNVEAAFAYDGLAKVLAEPRRFQISTFDYED